METPQPIATLGDLGYVASSQLATILDIEITTLRNWRSKGLGPPATKVHGNKIVYHIDGVKKWLTERAQVSTKPGTLITGKTPVTRTKSKPARRARS